jgi:hypothetical protein
MIVYPSVLPSNARAFNFVSSKAYNPQNDIVMSVEYAISGNPNSEAGIAFFIHGDSSLAGGLSGADLSYSGYLSTGTVKGIGSALACIGIDSTGVFGLSAGLSSYDTSLSASVDSVYRDGFMESDIIPNSVAARAGNSQLYALSTFGNYYRAISSFNIIGDNTLKYLRFRVGDVGRTMFLDYKKDFNTSYENIAAVPIGNLLGVTETSETYYKVGMGFTTPVSANNTAATCNFCFRRVHLEGLVVSLTAIQPLLEVWENIFDLWPDVGESWSF